MYAEFNERAEVATSRYSATGNFLQYISSVLVDKKYQKIRSRCLVHEFSFTNFFNESSHGCRAAVFNKKSLFLLSFYVAWLRIAIMKKCAERYALQLYRTSIKQNKFLGRLQSSFIFILQFLKSKPQIWRSISVSALYGEFIKFYDQNFWINYKIWTNFKQCPKFNSFTKTVSLQNELQLVFKLRTLRFGWTLKSFASLSLFIMSKIKFLH